MKVFKFFPAWETFVCTLHALYKTFENFISRQIVMKIFIRQSENYVWVEKSFTGNIVALTLKNIKN